MITDVCQRWNKRKSSYRPAGELGRVNPHDYEVAPIDGDGSDTIVKAFVAGRTRAGDRPVSEYGPLLPMIVAGALLARYQERRRPPRGHR